MLRERFPRIKNRCGLSKNVQVHSGSSGSEAVVSPPHSQVQVLHLNCLTLYQLWLFSHSPLPPLLQFLASDSSRCCKKFTLADVTMCSRLGSWRRKSKCLEDGRWKWTPLDHTACLRVAQHRCGQERSFLPLQQISQVWGMSKMEMRFCERI